MRQALMAMGLMVLLLSVKSDILRQSLRSNSVLIQVMPTVSQAGEEALGDLFQLHNLSEHPVSLKSNIFDDHVTGDGIINAKLVLATLAGDYEEASNTALSQPESCLRRPACRILAGKAGYLIGNDELAINNWRELLLWRLLIGNVAKTPFSEAEFNELDHYYGLLLEIYPNEPDAYFMLGSIRRSFGRWEDALPYFTQAVELGSKRPRYLCALGQALIVTKRDITQGLALCDKALELDSDDMWLYHMAASSLIAAGACDEAQELFHLAIARFPSHVEPQLWLEQLQEGLLGGCTPADIGQDKKSADECEGCSSNAE